MATSEHLHGHFQEQIDFIVQFILQGRNVYAEHQIYH